MSSIKEQLMDKLNALARLPDDQIKGFGLVVATHNNLAPNTAPQVLVTSAGEHDVTCSFGKDLHLHIHADESQKPATSSDVVGLLARMGIIVGEP